jgi:hypothetical protein
MTEVENLLKFKIKCFQHCVKTERLLCFKIPETCPTCLKPLNSNTTTFLIPPFILPTPLTITSNELNGYKSNLPPYCLLLQPTNGNYENFLLIINQKQQQGGNSTIDKIINDFGDLHIGITNSKSEIFDFDLNGLNRNSLKWFKIPSIVIRLTHHYENQNFVDKPQKPQNIINDENLRFLFYNYYYLNFNKWDFILDNYWYNQRHTKWSLKSYNEINFNCLDFVIQFLIDYDYKFQNFNPNSANSIDNIKYLVSNHLIEPEFIKCFKYMNLLAKIKKNDFFIENISLANSGSGGSNYTACSISSSSSSSKIDDEVVTSDFEIERGLKINENLVTISTRM